MNCTSYQEQNNKLPANKGAEVDVNMDDGFSNDEDIEDEVVYKHDEEWRKLLQCQDEKFGLKLDNQGRDITKKTYSLEPDMISGWAPKVPFCKPIPLLFSNDNFDGLLSYYTKYAKRDQSKKLKLCYLGARYETTYYAWYEKQFEFPYKHLSAPKTIQITDRFLCGQHWDAEGDDCIQFDSIFEGGNLDAVFKVGDYEYELFMRIDSNTRGHLQWFNFKMKNLEEGKTYKLKICNFQKTKGLYSRGMTPYFYSDMRYRYKNIGWTQLETGCKYRRKTSKTQKILEYESDSTGVMLSFYLTPEYPNDTFQLSYCIPYNYSKLMRKLEGLLSEHQRQNIIKMKKMCLSLGGLEVPELTITQNASQEEELTSKKQRIQNKKVILMTGRCHPGESNGSWMVDGILDFLVSKTEEAQFFRKHTIIKIVPMLNPDGVVIGNYRTGLSGKDFNRQFINPDKDLFPQIYHLKQLFWKYKQLYQNDAIIYLDFHGHSVKKNAFAYGPEYSIVHKNYYESRLIPKMIGNKTNMFRYYSCIFKISQHKQKTGRAIFLRNMKIPFTYTIQASNGFFYNQQTFKNEPFDDEKWRSVGENIMKGIFSYLNTLKQVQRIKMMKIKQRQLKNKTKNSTKKPFAKSGVQTSLGFRKTRNSMVQEEEISFAELINNTKFTSEFEEMMKQITGESSQKQGMANSDDEISEGNSDSEGSHDDLQQQKMEDIIQQIKNKTREKKSLNKITKRNVKNGIVKSHTFEEDLQNDAQQNPDKQKKKKISNTNCMYKKFFLKKKNSFCTTPSPKKQQVSTGPVARIVNFSFSIKPTQISLSKQKEPPKNESKKVEQNTRFRQTQMSFTELSSAKKQTRPYEYSQTFKKSFMSVQKEILRRQSHKRYLVTLNNSANQNKPKPCYIVQNIKPKRAHTEYN